MDENKILKALEQIDKAIKLHTELFNAASEETKKMHGYEENLDILTTTKEALEKQLPKKPKMRHIKKHDNFNDGWCPCCKSHVQELHFDRNFCQECGQRLDWSE